MEGDLHNSTQQQRTITSSFINETVDQELQLTDLQQLNGAWLVPAICIGAAGAAGAVGGWVLNDFWEANKEDIADAIHDLISDEKGSENGNCTGYRGGGSCSGGKYDKPVLR